MKPLAMPFKLFTLGWLALACAAAYAQTWKTPTKLAGKWITAENRQGNRINVSLDPAAGTGSLSIGFAEERCNIRSAPVTMAMLGGRITLKTVDGYASRCTNELTLEMVPNPGPKGAVGYLGELRLSGSAANRAQILRGRLTEP